MLNYGAKGGRFREKPLALGPHCSVLFVFAALGILKNIAESERMLKALIEFLENKLLKL